MALGIFSTPTPSNEPVRSYAPGTPERASLRRELDRQADMKVEVPLRIGGRAVTTGRTGTMRMPHDHRHELGVYHKAGPEEVAAAIEAAERARPEWAALSWEDRAAVFLRAADLLAGRFRDRLNAATMLGQSKTAHQAEIDAACELVDFFRFNVHYYRRILEDQPESAPGMWNRLEYRPLDGFVFAVTPFNFTSIAGNLPTAPALCGNTVVWKPASTAVLSAHYVMDLLEEAGLPPGVVNFVPGSGAEVGDPVLASPRLGGVHFTGSTEVFQGIWASVGKNIAHYAQYPRLVGETGGKDFVFAHASADPVAVGVALVRGAFEYQGQKCSAASRAYLPESLWPAVREYLADTIPGIAMGDVRDFKNFMGAVIDERSYAKLTGAIAEAHEKVGDAIVEILGGEASDEVGYFVGPTVLVTRDPKYRTMYEELFGPILTIYVYPDDQFEETLRLCDETSPYGLTGAVFARDRAAIVRATEFLRFAAGNFYVNDKPTGAVVGQQPFGGSRASGTNDKAGSALNLLRWMSPRTIKETFDPPRDYRYPYMDEA
ncbi:MAG: L-glutamate gamma-semialdehyde dehydrogenase [Deltaproteobacteria bacterium]|nr:MAG: L-glutamate gamma-semialdehyde dehydrogenase [Deltaproteobacteria bacterium]